MVTSGFAMRRRTCRPAAPTHTRARDEIDISDITVSLVKKEGKKRRTEREREAGREDERKGARNREREREEMVR